MAWTGFKRSIVVDDLWNLNSRDASSTVVPKFNSNWEPKLKAANLKKSSGPPSASFNAEHDTVIIDPSKPKDKAREKLSIFMPLVKSFGVSFFFGSIFKFVSDIMLFVAPQILNLLIQFTSSDEPMWKVSIKYIL